jgi:nitrate reductase gamma subunit
VQRFVIRLLAVAFLVVVAVPAVVLGGACLIAAIVGAILLWAIRRLANAATSAQSR